jgi:hypothetical protein
MECVIGFFVAVFFVWAARRGAIEKYCPRCRGLMNWPSANADLCRCNPRSIHYIEGYRLGQKA